MRRRLAIIVHRIDIVADSFTLGTLPCWLLAEQPPLTTSTSAGPDE